MFNARSESADTSGAFKDAFASTRCLIPADGFYEWTKSPADGGKDPWHIFLPGHQAFSFAGLWAYNKKLDITSCTIITAAAGEPMRQIHDRQPVILDSAVYAVSRRGWSCSRIPRGGPRGFSGGHVWDGATLEQQLRVRGFVDVETCPGPAIVTFAIGRRP